MEKLAASMNEASPQMVKVLAVLLRGLSKATKCFAYDGRTTALKQQIDQGLVEVEQRDDKVFITVGSGGAFPSGTADLTEEAQRILDRISLAAMSPEHNHCDRAYR